MWSTVYSCHRLEMALLRGGRRVMLLARWLPGKQIDVRKRGKRLYFDKALSARGPELLERGAVHDGLAEGFISARKISTVASG